MLTELQPLLSLIGSMSVIAGTVFVVIQLRINAKQAASRNAFDLVGRITDPSFPVRRHLLYEVAAKHASGDWQGFDHSPEDFQVRAFANIYEQLGLLVRKGVVDLPYVMEALSAQVLADWSTFQPIRRHIMEEGGKAFPDLPVDKPGIDSIYWPNFQWLANQNTEWVKKRVGITAP